VAPNGWPIAPEPQLGLTRFHVMAEICVDASLGPYPIITLDGTDVRQHLGGEGFV